MNTAETIHLTPRELPLVRRVDVSVAGGSVSAVAAAVAAAKDGTRVLLVAPRLFLGEDICGTMRLWREDSSTCAGPLVSKIFGRRSVVAPLRVKRLLEDALLEAGVEVLFGSMPSGVLQDADEHIAGLVIANRAGRQAIASKVLIDATHHRLLAQIAGAAEYEATSSLRVSRIILGGTDTSPCSPSKQLRSGVMHQDEELFYHEYELELDLPALSPAGFSEIEQRARDITYREGQIRAAESLDYAVRFIEKPKDRLFVLASSPGEQSEAVGTRVGREAADQAKTLPGPSDLRPLAAPFRTPANGLDVRENLHGLRPGDSPSETVPTKGEEWSILKRVDVVIAGGGTSGAAAAIAAVRSGASVLVLEYQEALGGTGTVGLIGKPYHGLTIGFAKEVPFPDRQRNTEYKMEWLRREIRNAGGSIWVGALAYGACMRGDRVCGLAVATPWGAGIVLAKTVIDASGNADIAAAAGTPCRFGEDDLDIALQGAGLPLRPIGKDYVNTDYLLVDEADVIDVTRALIGAKRAVDPDSCYDVAPFIQSRERRRVVGDVTLSYLDQLLGRTYPDSVVQSKSDYDSHGYPSLPFFALLPHNEKTRKANHPAPSGSPYTPYRALLPETIDGMLVVGLGASMHRDASAMIRMQRDLANQGYAAGLAAAMIAESGCATREVDIKQLQQKLVAMGALPESVLTDTDSFPLPQEQISEAVRTVADPESSYDTASRAMAVIFTHPLEAMADLLSAFGQSENAVRLTLAKLLGFLGQPDGVTELVEALDAAEFDAKILQGRMAEYAHLPTPVDALILALGYSGDDRALDPILRKIERLDAETTLSHHRSVALALENLATTKACRPLARLLAKPGMTRHTMENIEPLYDFPVERRRREGALREIVLARALYRCGDWDGVAARILEAYCRDLRGLFARHARLVLRKTAVAVRSSRPAGSRGRTASREVALRADDNRSRRRHPPGGG